MKTSSIQKAFLTGAVILVLKSLSCFAQELPDSMKYGGYPTPGIVPEQFAPDLAEYYGSVRKIAITPDNREAFFIRVGAGGPEILYSAFRDSAWIFPETPSFLTGDHRYSDPAVSANNFRFYFTRRDSIAPNVFSAPSIWTTHRSDSGWVTPQRLPDHVNFLSASNPIVDTDSSIIYMVYSESEGRYNLCRSALDGGIHDSASVVPPPVTGDFSTGGQAVSPNGRFMTFSSNRPGSLEQEDLFISIRNEDGSWYTPENLGRLVNNRDKQYASRFTSDGNYFFFTAGIDAIEDQTYWMDAIYLEKFTLYDSLRYFSQPKPVAGPELFASDIVGYSAWNPTWTPDNRAMYYTRDLPGGSFIFGSVLDYLTGDWTEPDTLDTFRDFEAWSPFVSPKGDKLYISTTRTPDGEPGRTDVNIWVSDLTDTGWSEPMLLPEPVNSVSFDGNPVIASDGTMYFLSDRPGGKGGPDIYMALPDEDGNYTTVQNLSAVNSASNDIAVTLTPDMRTMVFPSNREGTFGDYDLFISFYDENGQWSDPQHLNETVNGVNPQLSPRFSLDGKYLFYLDNGNLMWISSDNLEIEVIDPVDRIKGPNTETFHVYPNPASNYFTVESDGPAVLQLIAADGKYLWSREVNGVTRFVAPAVPGVYFLSVESESGRTIQKLIVSP